MEGRHGAKAPSLFRRGRGGGKPDSRGREKTAHGATFTEPPNPRSRIRSRRFADESERARHRIDRRRARLSRSCAVGAYSGGGSRGGSAARRATGQTDFRHGLPNRGWKAFGCRVPPASCGTSCSISKSGFRATTRQSWPTTSSAASLISLSSAGNRSLISNTNWWQGSRFSYFCRVIIGSPGTRPSIHTISSVRHLSAYQKSRACCVLLSVII